MALMPQLIIRCRDNVRISMEMSDEEAIAFAENIEGLDFNLSPALHISNEAGFNRINPRNIISVELTTI
jgi:hypothetical protein